MRTPVVILTHEPHMALGAIDTLELLDGTGCIVIVDDSGDDEWRTHAATLADEVVAVAEQGEQGYAAGMRTVWATARRHGWPRFVLWEQDFRLNGRVCLAPLSALLDMHPRLTQVALQRQAGGGLDHDPWYDIERKHGGVIAAIQATWPERVTVHDGWVEQSRIWTSNPSLIDARALSIPWPMHAGSELAYSRRAARAGHRFAYWGEPGRVLVEHIGTHSEVGH